MRNKKLNNIDQAFAGRSTQSCGLLLLAMVGLSGLVAPQPVQAERILLESGSVSTTATATSAQPAGTASAAHLPTAQELATLKSLVDASPNVAKAHYNYAHALRAAGKQSQAVVEYLDASQLEPTLYVAYHELSLSKARPEQLDEAIDRLKLLQEHRPKDLLLCVSLSELFEQRDELYPAAKVLTDLVYGNCVPEKYLPRVKARIHFLLNKNREEQTLRKVQSEEPEADAAPLPLPESSLRRSLSASRLKDAKVMQNFGHSQLLP